MCVCVCVVCAHIIPARCVECVQYPVSKHKFQTRSLYTTRTHTRKGGAKVDHTIQIINSSTYTIVPWSRESFCESSRHSSSTMASRWLGISVTDTLSIVSILELSDIHNVHISYIQPIMVYTHPQYDCVENTMILIGHTLPP